MLTVQVDPQSYSWLLAGYMKYAYIHINLQSITLSWNRADKQRLAYRMCAMMFRLVFTVSASAFGKAFDIELI